MTSLRAMNEVRVAMETFGLHPVITELGEIFMEDTLSVNKYNSLKEILSGNNFELIDDKETIIIEKTKQAIIQMIHNPDELPGSKYSDYISRKLCINYTYLSKLFSKINHVSIEHFIIAQKIERVKQFLLFGDLTLSEIAWKLRYSSTAHLSAQFKKVTGLTPSRFRKLQSSHLSKTFDV
jgi:AraC-like DNA-binding protein